MPTTLRVIQPRRPAPVTTSWLSSILVSSVPEHRVPQERRPGGYTAGSLVAEGWGGDDLSVAKKRTVRASGDERRSSASRRRSARSLYAPSRQPAVGAADIAARERALVRLRASIGGTSSSRRPSARPGWRPA